MTDLCGLDLQLFVRESNWIESIRRAPEQHEIDAHTRFLQHDYDPSDLREALKAFVYVVTGRSLRDRPGMNVGVMNHVAPAGGPLIAHQLWKLLDEMPKLHPVELHQRYLYLHPFMDGNGRSSRVLYLYHMLRFRPKEETKLLARVGFLHSYYYMTLDLADRNLMLT